MFSGQIRSSHADGLEGQRNVSTSSRIEPRHHLDPVLFDHLPMVSETERRPRFNVS